jgi:hypothetical protein
VRAVDVNGNEEKNQNRTTILALDTTPPASPTNLTAKPLPGGKIELRWQKPPGESPAYKVYRCTSPDPGKMVLLTTVNDTMLIDSDLVNGREYHYIVRAMDTAGNEEKNQVFVSATVNKGGPRVILAFGLVTVLVLGIYTADQRRKLEVT